jgi:hypothetical protein
VANSAVVLIDFDVLSGILIYAYPLEKLDVLYAIVGRTIIMMMII